MPHSTEIHITDARLVDLHLRSIEVVCVRCDTSTIQRSYASISYMVSGTFRFCYMQTCTSRMLFCYNKYFKELISCQAIGCLTRLEANL